MKGAATSRYSRRFVAVGVVSLLVWHVAAIAGLSRSTHVVLGLFGFVFHVVFGKAYALVPAYFDRELAVPFAVALHLPLSVAGTVFLAGWTLGGPALFAFVGSASWALGVLVFVGSLGTTIRDNLTGAETGTNEVNVHRRPVDRLSNAAIPVVFAYLLVGTYELLAAATDVPPVLGGGLPVAAHLLAAGAVTLLLFAVGFRLLPRFLVETPPTSFVGIVLAAGTIAPALLAADFWGGQLFRVGAGLQAVAVAGFAAAYVRMYLSTERDRVGFHGVLAGVASGLLGVGLGVGFAAGMVDAGYVPAHLRLNVMGFLGLSIVGVAYQFYPPAVGVFPGCTDRSALASILLLAGGLWIEAAGSVPGWRLARPVGAALGVLGSALFAYLLAGVFRRQMQRSSGAD